MSSEAFEAMSPAAQGLNALRAERAVIDAVLKAAVEHESAHRGGGACAVCDAVVAHRAALAAPLDRYVERLAEAARDFEAQFRAVTVSGPAGAVGTVRSMRWLLIAVTDALVARTQEVERLRAPIDMILPCPNCGMLHVDAPEPENNWTNPPHKSHLCHGCGLVWRPADVPTNGVATIATRGERDTYDPAVMRGPRPVDGSVNLDAMPRGMPTTEAVAAHEAAHPAPRGGAAWLCYHTDSPFGAYPAIVTLRVGKPGETIMGETFARVDVSGAVLLANGFSFWQLLAPCKWAAWSVYVPCTAQGIPLLPANRREVETILAEMFNGVDMASPEAVRAAARETIARLRHPLGVPIVGHFSDVRGMLDGIVIALREEKRALALKHVEAAREAVDGLAAAIERLQRDKHELVDDLEAAIDGRRAAREELAAGHSVLTAAKVPHRDGARLIPIVERIEQMKARIRALDGDAAPLITRVREALYADDTIRADFDSLMAALRYWQEEAREAEGKVAVAAQHATEAIVMAAAKERERIADVLRLREEQLRAAGYGFAANVAGCLFAALRVGTLFDLNEPIPMPADPSSLPAPTSSDQRHDRLAVSLRDSLQPWHETSEDRRRDLVKARSLLLAEIERLLRAEDSALPAPVLSREQGIEECARAVWPILWAHVWSARSAIEEKGVTSLVLAILRADPGAAAYLAESIRRDCTAAVLDTARRLVDEGRCPELADMPALRSRDA